MPVYVKRSTDSGAPALVSAASSILAVLDWALVAAAGWAKVYTVGDVAVYRAPTGLRKYLRVDASVVYTTAVRAYDTMSDVDTGTGPYPSVAQVAAPGLELMHGYYSADAVAKAYVLHVSERSFYLQVFNQAGPADIGARAYMQGMFFGDLAPSYKAADAHHSVLICGTSDVLWSRVTSAVDTTGHYVCRSHDQITATQMCVKTVRTQHNDSYVIGSDPSFAPYPDPITGGILLAPVEVTERCTPGVNTSWSERGRMPGAFAPLHQAFGAQGDTFPGAGALFGVDFELVKAGSATGAMQTTGEWY